MARQADDSKISEQPPARMGKRVLAWVSERPWRIGVPVAVIALCGASAVGIIDRDLRSFWTSLVNNAVVVGVITAFVAVVESHRQADSERLRTLRQSDLESDAVRRLRRILMASVQAWGLPYDRNDQPSAQELPITTDDVVSLSRLADRLDSLHRQRFNQDAEANNLMRIQFLTPLVNAIEQYEFEGGRRRRFLALSMARADLAQIAVDAIEPHLRELIVEFRDQVFNVLLWKSHTDTAVLQRLVVEQKVRPLGQSPPDADLRATLDAPALDSSAVVGEPLDLLRSFCWYHASDAPLARPDKATEVVRRCLGALRQEVRGLAVTLDSMLTLLSEVDRH